MSDFEPYLGNFHQVQPDLAKMVKDEYKILDLFKTAVENNWLTFFKILVQDSGKIQAVENQLHLAAEYGDLQIVSFYTKIFDNPNPRVFDSENQKINGTTPLHVAAQFGHLEIVQQISNLLQDKNPADENQFTPLHLAARYGHLDIVQFLVPQLENKFPKSGSIKYEGTLREWHGMTPLHEAAVNGHLKVIEYLLTFVDDDINPPQGIGFTVMSIAAYFGHLDVVSYYTEKLENVNPKQKSGDEFNGRTPLHYAAEKGHLSVVEHICNLLQDKNPSDDNGYTPLHNAAFNGHLQIVQYLVQFLDNPHPRNGNYWGNKTPLDLAKQKGRTQVVKFLKSIKK